jgi:hypothetical protein
VFSLRTSKKGKEKEKEMQWAASNYCDLMNGAQCPALEKPFIGAKTNWIKYCFFQL